MEFLSYLRTGEGEIEHSRHPVFPPPRRKSRNLLNFQQGALENQGEKGGGRESA